MQDMKEKVNPYVYAGIDYSKVPIVDILDDICRITHVSHADVISESRKVKNVIARQIFCFIARKQTGAKYSEIGKVINRDRTSAIHSCKKVRQNIEINDAPTMKIYRKVEKFINQNN